MKETFPNPANDNELPGTLEQVREYLRNEFDSARRNPGGEDTRGAATALMAFDKGDYGAVIAFLQAQKIEMENTPISDDEDVKIIEWSNQYQEQLENLIKILKGSI